MDSLDLLDIEPNFLDPVLDIEVEETIRIIKRTLRQYGDHVKCETVILQQTHRTHHLLMCSMPAARASAGVVEACRTVDTEPDRRSRSGKEPHPTIVQEQSIGLETVRQFQAVWAPLRYKRK